MSLRNLSYALYGIGLFLVVVSYFGMVSKAVAWIGWGVGMVGWAIWMVKRPSKDGGDP